MRIADHDKFQRQILRTGVAGAREQHPVALVIADRAEQGHPGARARHRRHHDRQARHHRRMRRDVYRQARKITLIALGGIGAGCLDAACLAQPRRAAPAQGRRAESLAKGGPLRAHATHTLAQRRFATVLLRPAHQGHLRTDIHVVVQLHIDGHPERIQGVDQCQRDIEYVVQFNLHQRQVTQ